MGVHFLSTKICQKNTHDSIYLIKSIYDRQKLVETTNQTCIKYKKIPGINLKPSATVTHVSRCRQDNLVSEMIFSQKNRIKQKCRQLHSHTNIKPKPLSLPIPTSVHSDVLTGSKIQILSLSTSTNIEIVVDEKYSHTSIFATINILSF